MARSGRVGALFALLTVEQVLTFSARPSSYLVATDTNYVYGERSSRRGRPERRLFPGVLPVLLAITGLTRLEHCAACRTTPRFRPLLERGCGT